MLLFKVLVWGPGRLRIYITDAEPHYITRRESTARMRNRYSIYELEILETDVFSSSNTLGKVRFSHLLRIFPSFFLG
jgi:hypothetical protein